MKKIFTLILALCIILTGCNSSRTGEFSKDSNAIVDQKNGWIYYLKRSEQFKYSGRNVNSSEVKSGDIYRARIDGSQKEKLVEGKIENANMLGDYIFYTKEKDRSTFVYNTVTSENKVLLKDRYVNIVKVLDNVVYYIDNNYSTTTYIPRLYRVDLTGQNEKLLFEGNFASLYIGKDNIYFVNSSENNNIYRMNTDGSEKTKIIQRNVNKFLIDKDKIYYSAYNYFANSGNVIIVNDYDRKMAQSKAYIPEKNEKEVEGGFFSADLDGKNEIKLIPDNYVNFYIDNDWIYYFGGSSSGLHKMKKDGTEKIKLITDGMFYDYGMTKSSVYSFNSEPNIKLNMYDGYIYYVNNFDKNRLYRIRIDKTGKERVTHETGIGIYLLSEGYIYYYGSGEQNHIYRINLDGTNKILID